MTQPEIDAIREVEALAESLTELAEKDPAAAQQIAQRANGQAQAKIKRPRPKPAAQAPLRQEEQLRMEMAIRLLAKHLRIMSQLCPTGTAEVLVTMMDLLDGLQERAAQALSIRDPEAAAALRADRTPPGALN